MSTSTVSLLANGSTSRTVTPRAPSRASISSNSLKSPSLLGDDDAEQTVTGKRIMVRARQPSQEDLRVLAASAQMTEISYSISDIQTRIFEIQELRHQTQAAEDVAPTNGDGANGSTSVIDQALINLDERLEAVAKSIAAIDDAFGISPNSPSEDKAAEPEPAFDLLLVRKHAAIMEEWIAVQSEAEVLRDELKEDKWLAVFRTVSEQAEGMMASLEKAITQCHDFIWQVYRRNQDDSQMHSVSTTSVHLDNKPAVNYEVFNALLQSFEAKKKHYVPSITKVLAVLDKGIQDRVTKNGECLRRHADLRARWRNLHERIGRIDTEMEGVRRILVNRDVEPSEAGSAVSRVTTKSRNGMLSTNGSSNRSASSSRTAASTGTSASRPLSPFSNIRKFATKVSDKIAGRTTPSVYSPPPSSNGSGRMSRTDGPRKSGFFSSFRPTPPTPETPPRHSHSQSITTGSTSSPSIATKTSKSTGTTREPWNATTKIVESSSVPPATVRRKASASMLTPANSLWNFTPNSTNSRRPVTPSAASSYSPPSVSAGGSPSRPPSQAGSRVPRPPSQAGSHVPRPPSQAGSRLPRPTTPGFGARPRPQSPSHIPVPVGAANNPPEEDWDGMPTSLMQRAFSPALSVSGASAVSGPMTPSARPRTPGNSLIPVPTLNLPPSRPGSALGARAASATPSPSTARSHTPENLLKMRASQVPFLPTPPRPGTRAVSGSKGPPSSFRDASQTPPRAPSRPASRSASRQATVFTPGMDAGPAPVYIPVKTDPLDVEVAKCSPKFRVLHIS